MAQYVPTINPFNLPQQPTLPNSPQGGIPVQQAPVATGTGGAQTPGFMDRLITPENMALLQFGVSLLQDRAPGTSQGAAISSGLLQGVQSLSNARQGEAAGKRQAGIDQSEGELRGAKTDKLKAETANLGGDTAKQIKAAQLALTKAREEATKAQIDLTNARTSQVGMDKAEKAMEAKRKLVLQHVKSLADVAFLSPDSGGAATAALEEGIQLLKDVESGKLGETTTTIPPEFTQYGADEWGKVVANPQLRKQIEDKYGAAQVSQYLKSLGLE